MTFRAERDITIHAAPGDHGHGFRLRSEGLAERGLPELEMIDVPEARARDAAVVINQVADYVATKSRIEDGQRLAIRAPSGALVATLQAGSPSSSSAPPPGLFARMFGGARTTHVQRVHEPLDTMEHPRTLLSTVMLWRARAQIEAGDVEGARRELFASVAYFPGDPGKRSDLFMGFAYNWQNHLSYAALSEISLDDGERRAWMDKALERSEELEQELLGDSAADLARASREDLLAETDRIVTENLRTAPSRHPVTGAVVAFGSPTWRRESTSSGPTVARSMTVLPELFERYYYDPLVAVQLRSPSVRAIAVDVLLARRGEPAELALTARDIASIYEGDVAEAPAMVIDPPYYRPGDRLLSLLLADIAKRLFAGLTEAELRAGYGLSQDRGLAQSAALKLAEIDRREGEAYMDALGA
jgi:hypothetical protein